MSNKDLFSSNKSDLRLNHSISLYKELINSSKDFSNLIKNNEQKALYFCRSGARSSTIWGIASVLYLDKDINEVMNKINNIGYDSSVIPNMVEHFKALE